MGDHSVGCAPGLAFSASLATYVLAGVTRTRVIGIDVPGHSTGGHHPAAHALRRKAPAEPRLRTLRVPPHAAMSVVPEWRLVRGSHLCRLDARHDPGSSGWSRPGWLE